MRIPHELLRSTPRELNLTAVGRFVAVMAWLLAVSGIVVSVWLYSLATQARENWTEAIPVPARVVRLGATRGEHPKWVATYVYRAGGETYERSETLGRRDRQKLAVGDTLPIRYLPAAPTRSWVEGYQPGVPVLLSPIAFVSFGLAAGAIVLTLRRQRTMLAQGRPAVATVTAVKRVSHQHGHTYRATVEYQTLTGGRTTRRLDVTKATAVGSEMIVLYDADTPTRALRYPMSLVRPASW